MILAGIAKVESDDGRSTLPGVHSGANAFGAAGPMQIGIGGAAGNQWGGAPVHPAGEKVNGVATDANHDGIASVYEPADAIAGAAKYLLAHGVLDNPEQAIFAYNHLESYVQAVLYWASLYASGGYTVSAGHPCQRAAVPARRRSHAEPAPSRPLIAYRRAADRQAVSVGRHRPRCLRLLGAGDDGLPGRGPRHPAHLAAAVGRGARGSAPARSSQATWSSSPGLTAR